MPLWSAFVAASFIFGTSARDAFEAIIFVFVTVWQKKKKKKEGNNNFFFFFFFFTKDTIISY
jgi:hypothetical protein